MAAFSDTERERVAAGMAQRGRHKIYVGMAAGVGKTYRMLQEGHALAEAGADVVIGYLEPHDRPETAAQAVGLEIVPRRRVRQGELTLEEMDLPALLGRAPEIALIDELAHTNAPGLEHAKRYEDVADVLAAGINVLSTVNIQHLESLNDQVAELTGVRVRETFPDSVLQSADEIVLIDLTPQALIQRLQEGRVYAPERVPAALNNFFTVENLSALREMVLRELAEDVESKRLVREVVGTREQQLASATGQAVGERLLALAAARPSSQRLVRRAWRSAQRLGAELDILHVAKPGFLRANKRGDSDQVDALRRLAAALGAHLIVEEGDDVAETAARVGAERGTTYVLIGEPRSAKGLRRFGISLPEKLMQRMPGVDIRIVANRTKHAEREELES